ncbi:MAG: hypothetical protein LBS14_02750 [Holosporaceae bacterium]|jgi:hypothetical protein|nr:hypothetical protein [Holosporaceae bacterium]
MATATGRFYLNNFREVLRQYGDGVSRLLCILVFAVLLSVRLENMRQKAGLHVDEILSIQNADCNGDISNQLIEQSEKYGKEYIGKEVKEHYLWNESSVEAAFSDVKKLYIDNRDRPHTNLYYSCLRLWFAGITTTDIRIIIDHGCRLNLLFFTFSFIFLYMLLRRLLDGDFLIPFSLFIAFANTGSISNTMFLRPYQLQETLLILFTFLFVKCNECIADGRQLDQKMLYGLVTATGLTLLSGYYATIYVLMLFGGLFVRADYAKQHGNCVWISGALVLSILLARSLFQGFFYGFSCGRAGESYRNISSLCKINESMGVFNNSLRSYLFDETLIWLAFIWVAVLLLTRRQFIHIPVIFLCCFCWSFLCSIAMPIPSVRYIMPCFPLLIQIFPFLISRRSGSLYYIVAGATAFLTVGYWCSPPSVKYLFTKQAQQIQLLCEKKSLPVVVLADENWKFCYILHLFNDEQRYVFVSSTKTLESRLKTYDSVLVLYFTVAYDENQLLQILRKDFMVTKLQSFGDFFSLCELKRK